MSNGLRIAIVMLTFVTQLTIAAGSREFDVFQGFAFLPAELTLFLNVTADGGV